MERHQGTSVMVVAGKAIVRHTDGRVLLIRRAPDSRTDAGCWDLPGGKMDNGEALRDALVREVNEETGLKVMAGPPIHVCHFTKHPFWVTCVTFVCDYTGGDVRLSEEHDEFAWVELADIVEYPCAAPIRQQLNAYTRLARG